MTPPNPPSNQPPRRPANQQPGGQPNGQPNGQPYNPPNGPVSQPPGNRRPGAEPARPVTPGEPAPGRAYQPLAGERRPAAPPPPPPGQFFSPPTPGKKPRPRRNRSRQNLPAGAVVVKSGPRIAWGPLFGYAALTALVVGVLIGLFVATRLFGFLNNISVARQDVNGQVIGGSSVTGHGRVNIILLGLDRRPNDAEGTRSDTMLLVSLDQDNKTANVLSIPRDLWIKIPGHGNNRVNTAYFFGDQERPGVGGPPLVKQAILDNFGIRVDYFVEVDFNGFRSIIDALGGITLDVKKPLIDNEYPTEDYGIKRIYIPAGIQHMDGQTALEYARSRHSDSDLGRNQRQQEVLLAVRERGVNLGLLTNTKLQQALQGAIKTDLTAGDLLSLGQTAIGIKKEAIKQFAIDANITHNANIDGNEVLVADPDALNQLLQQFQTSSPAPAATTAPAARISVLNGTFQAGRAASTQKYLESKGYAVASIDQAPDAGKYPQTVINVYSGQQQAAANSLAQLLGVNPANIHTKSGGPNGIDLEIICGDDLKLPS